MFSLHDKQLADRILGEIKNCGVSVRFMHVCGTHQDTLVKSGLDALLRSYGVCIGQGPGCPVCVTTPREIEEILLLARKGVMVASFGDMVRVPGEAESLLSVRGEGCDVRVVYGIEDAVKLARDNPGREVVFMAVGFETTTPSTALMVVGGVPENFSVLCCHRLIPPALEAILEMGEFRLDGFIEPGHVSTIIGVDPYRGVSERFGVPQVVAGFEPLDLLMAVWMLIRQVVEGRAEVENEYVRVVQPEGNKKALEVMQQVFEPCDVAWRGFPVIPGSGLRLRGKFAGVDARKKYEDELSGLAGKKFVEPAGCRCGEVLRGLISSQECPLFGNRCVPEHPVGPCMVSVEGSCQIEYRYGSRQ